MAVVHCWYGCIRPHPDEPDLGDGFVWACFGAVGVEDLPGEDLERYHHWVPLHPCPCGYDPRLHTPAPAPAPEPAHTPEPVGDGYWHPAGHP